VTPGFSFCLLSSGFSFPSPSLRFLPSSCTGTHAGGRSLKNYRLAAVDLDDTLLGPAKTISDENRLAIQTLQKAGILVIIASGRRHQNSIRFQRELDLHGPIIACQGGLLRDGESGNVIEAHFLPQSLTRDIVMEGEHPEIQVIYYHLDHLYVAKRHNRWIDLYESRVGEKTEVLSDLEKLDGRHALKIVWYGDPGVLQARRTQLETKYSGKADVFSTERENLEFMPRGVNKATALKKVSEELGVPREQVVAFGDNENDVHMLEWAGVGIAMSHGKPQAKAVADLVTPEGPPETALARGVSLLMQN
jgi:Cof subfamily protein (haloacid dehalogenase superfamily)